MTPEIEKINKDFEQEISSLIQDDSDISLDLENAIQIKIEEVKKE